MKQRLIPIVLIVILLMGCNNDDVPVDPSIEDDCLCDNDDEYICWNQNGTERKSTSSSLDYYDEYTSFNFGGYGFFGDIDNSEIGIKHTFKLPLKINFEYDENGEGTVVGVDGDILNTGVWGGLFSKNSNDLDTIFKNLKVKITKNTTTYFEGTFECSGAFTRGLTSDESNDSIYNHIDFEIKNGCFRLLK